MKILGYTFGEKEKEEVESIEEATKEFAHVGLRQTPEEQAASKGEGWESIHQIPGVGHLSLQSFNSFYSNYIDRMYENEVGKIFTYREMAAFTEVADVIEEATNESTQVDQDDKVIHLEIIDPELAKNENIVNNLNKEFNNLFYNQFSNAQDNFQDKLWDMVRSYYIDGRVYYEKVINTNDKTKGIVNLKKLPAETMDYIYNPTNGEIEVFMQYLRKAQGVQRPKTIEEAEKREDVILFYPEQIGFVNYGIYGRTKQEIFGFLEKARVPYNQLKLLEISVIIYRLIRSPERLVFRIDTGNMPRDKALKYVEKIKQKLSKKQTYNPETGELSNEPEIFCIRKNTEIPLLDGRYPTLEEIIKEHNKGKENWVYSINQKTLDIEPGKIVNAAITRKNEKLIRTWFDNDSYIDTTYDHKFILRDGNECRANELQVGKSLMPLYKRKKPMPSHHLDYEKIYNPGTNQWRWTHRISSRNIKKNEVRHHLDYNRFNNNPTNLKIMDKQIHLKFHQDLLKERWINDYDGQVESIRNGVKKWYSNPDNQKRHSEWVIKTNIEQNKTTKMRKVLNIPEVRKKQKEAVKKNMIERFSNPENRKKMRKIKSILFDDFLIKRLYDLLEKYYPTRDKLLKILSDDSIFMNHLKKINEKQSFSNIQYNHINKQTLWKIIEYLGFKDYPDFKQNFVYNHKIVKIEYIEERDDTGCITVEGNHNFAVKGCSSNTSDDKDNSLIFIKNSMLENFYLPQSADGRGSQIDTIGGNPAGFAELDDIYYFARKMYRALKYPMSRVNASQEKQDSDIMFGGSQTGEISRDEVKWAKFLERQQNKFNREFTKLFLLHMEFRGLKREYGLNMKKIRVRLNAPSNYKEQMEQNFQETRYNNYQALADRDEISKYYLMKKFLKWDEDDIKENVEGLKKDRELGLTSSDGGY